MRFLTGSVVLSLALSLVACGSSGSNASGGTDASTEDATSGSSSGGDSGGSDAADAASLFDAAPICPGKGVQCESCCDNAFPAGAKKFDTITLQCACKPDYCGPLDGGVADGGDAGSVDSGTLDAATLDSGSVDAAALDSGSDDAAAASPVLGTGQCTATCNTPQNPDPTCNACIRLSLGSTAAPGPCGVDILANCVTDVDCRPYFDCVTACE